MLKVPLSNGQETELFIERNGDVPRVLFLHGWLHSGMRWNAVRELLKVESMTLDLPGFGASPPISSSWQNIEDYSKIIDYSIARIDFEYKLKCIVADSLSAILILRLLEKGRLTNVKLIMSGAPAYGLPWYVTALSGVRELVPSALRLIRFLPAPIGEFLIRTTAVWTLLSRRFVDEIFVSDILKSDPGTAGNLLRALSKLDLSGSSFPVLQEQIVVVRGVFDKIADRKAAIKLAKQLDASFREIVKSSHTPMHENPAVYASIVNDILK